MKKLFASKFKKNTMKNKIKLFEHHLINNKAVFNSSQHQNNFMQTLTSLLVSK